MPTLNLSCDADTTLYEASASPMGTDAAIVLGRDATTEGIYRSIVKFTISSIPEGAELTTAILNLNCIEAASSAIAFSIVQVDPLKAWVESEADWDEFATSSLWDTEGGDFDTDGGESFVVMPTSTGAVTYNVLDNIVNARNRAHSATSLFLYHSNPDLTRAVFSSREAAAELRPTLTVNYTVGVSTGRSGFQELSGRIE